MMKNFANFNLRPEKINLYDSNIKKVDYVPSMGQVIIRNYPEDALDQKNAREEFHNAKKAEKTRVVPQVGKDVVKQSDGAVAYTQKYGGRMLEDYIDDMSPKQKYKLGNQLGRSQSRLVEQANLYHDDIFERNVTIPNPKKSKAYLIDNASLQKVTPDNIKYARKVIGLPDIVSKGFTKGIRFNSMKHFANFANIYQTGLQNLISPVVGKEAKKYVRKKKEEAATSSDEKE
jgi:hypothetical protein